MSLFFTKIICSTIIKRSKVFQERNKIQYNLYSLSKPTTQYKINSSNCNIIALWLEQALPQEPELAST
jgi:hypothetical protein